MWLPLVGLALGIALGLVLNFTVSPDLARYSAVAILAGLDSVLGAIRAELDAHYDNRIFLSGFVTNALVAVALTFVGDRLGIDLYLVALFAFGLRIFQNVALIRLDRHRCALRRARREQEVAWNARLSSSVSTRERRRSRHSSARSAAAVT